MKNKNVTNILIITIIFFTFSTFTLATDTISYAINSSDIMRSYDGFVTYEVVYTDVSYDFDKIVTSSTGQYVVAISNKGYNISNPSNILYSQNYGTTWSTSANAYPLMTDITISDDGQYIYIHNCSHNIRSTTGGSTWLAFSNGFISPACSLGDNRDIVTSSSGQYVYITENQVLRKSNNYGQNLTTIYTLGSGYFNGLCVSEDGTHLYTYPYNAQPLISNNSGTSFYLGAYSGTTLIWNRRGQTCYNNKAIVGDTSNNIIYSPSYMTFGTSTQYNDTSIDMVTDANNFTALYKVNSSDLYLSSDNSQSWQYINTINGLLWFTSSDGLVDSVTTADTFSVSLDSTNSNLVGTIWYSYPYGVPLQSYPIVVTTASVSDGFVGIQCNYTEQNIIDDKFEYDNTSLNGWIGCDFYTGTYDIIGKKSIYIDYTRCNDTTKKVVFPIGQQTEGSIILFKYYPTNNGTINVRLLNTLGTSDIISNFIEYDGSQVCIYKDSVTLPNRQYCFIYNPYVNGDITFRISVAYDIDYTYTIDSKMSTSTSYISGETIIFTNAPIGYIAFQTLDAKVYIDNLNISLIRGFSPYETIIDNVSVTTAISSGLPNLIGVNFTDYQACAFGQVYGNVKIRVYYHKDNIQTWDNYKDLNVELRTLDQKVTDGGATFDEQTQSFVDTMFGANLSQAQKLFYTILVMFVSILLIIIVGFSFGMGGLMTGVLSVALGLVELIFFAFIDFIPVWIIIMIGIVCAGMVAVFIKKIVAQ